MCFLILARRNNWTVWFGAFLLRYLHNSPASYSLAFTARWTFYIPAIVFVCPKMVWKLWSKTPTLCILSRYPLCTVIRCHCANTYEALPLWGDRVYVYRMLFLIKTFKYNFHSHSLLHLFRLFFSLSLSYSTPLSAIFYLLFLTWSLHYIRSYHLFLWRFVWLAKMNEIHIFILCVLQIAYRTYLSVKVRVEHHRGDLSR